MNNGIDICPISVLGFIECPTDNYQISGDTLIAQTYDFTSAINNPYWTLGFASLGNAYPYAVNVQQALFLNSLQVYPTNLPQIDAVTAQFFDQYETTSGLVQTKWQIAFNHAAKTIAIQNLFTKLPQMSSYRACSEILLSYWKMNIFTYAQPPSSITLPY